MKAILAAPDEVLKIVHSATFWQKLAKFLARPGDRRPDTSQIFAKTGNCGPNDKKSRHFCHKNELVYDFSSQNACFKMAEARFSAEKAILGEKRALR